MILLLESASVSKSKKSCPKLLKRQCHEIFDLRVLLDENALLGLLISQIFFYHVGVDFAEIFVIFENLPDLYTPGSQILPLYNRPKVKSRRCMLQRKVKLQHKIFLRKWNKFEKSYNSCNLTFLSYRMYAPYLRTYYSSNIDGFVPFSTRSHPDQFLTLYDGRLWMRIQIRPNKIYQRIVQLPSRHILKRKLINRILHKVFISYAEWTVLIEDGWKWILFSIIFKAGSGKKGRI